MAQGTFGNENMQIGNLLRNVARFFREKNKSNGALSRRKKARFRQIEMLEARHMMVAAIWHNVLQPLNVSGEPGGSVDPLDVLTVINEINNPKYSDRGVLIQDVPAGQSLPFFDVNCNSTVDPLDVLSIINAINSGVYDPSWNFEASQNTTGNQGRVTISACSPKLIEGDSLSTELNQTIVLPDDTSAVRVSFEAPLFDTLSRDAIRDAFEIVLLDRSGQPLSLPYGANRDAIYNWSESIVPAVGPAAKTTTLPAGSISTATFNLTGLVAGTPVQVVVRLVNDDTDTNSSVVIRRVEIVDIAELAPTGMSVPVSDRPAFVPVDPNLLTDVSPSVKPIYGRTTLVDDRDIVVTDLQMINQGSNALSGRIVVAIDNLSDPNIGVMHPDGFLPGGRPYFVLNGTSASGWLASGDKTATRELRFKNPSRQQFTYTLTTLAELNSPPTGFTSDPLLQIEAGKTYRTIAQADDPDKQALIYSIAAGPVGMTTDPASGQIVWATIPSDVGNHSVILRATDPFGLSVQQAFTIAVIANLPNRPPIFTSTPPTDATIAAPFEVQTFKTGTNPVAVTSGNFGNGTSFVTANPGDATIGFLGSDRVSTPISVGEPNSANFKTSFVTPLTVDLGFSPGTYENRDRDLNNMVTADVNEDGIPDLIVSVSSGGSSGSDYFNPSMVGHVGVRLGNGDGTFRLGWDTSLPAVTNFGSAAFGLHYVDLTNDGINDIVATQYLGKTVLVYKGLAGGTFADTPITSTYGGSSSTMQAADFNADGKIDVVLFENKPSFQFRFGFSTLLGNGDGSFGPETFYVSDNDNGGSGYVVDVDGKNGPDLVRVNPADQRLETRLNDGTGHFGSAIFSGTYAFGDNGGGPMGKFFDSPLTAYFGDFDGDSIPDASVSMNALGLFFLKGTGTGTFGDGTAAGNRFNTQANAPTGVAAHPATYYNDGKPFDFNADGKLDVIIGDSYTADLTIGLGKGDGTFALSSYNVQFADDIGPGYRGSQPTYQVNVADYNRDGVLDVAIGSASNGGRPGSVAIVLGDQIGTLRASHVVPFVDGLFGGPSVVADFTGDGIPDIALNNGQGIAVATGNGDGTFAKFQLGLQGVGGNSLVAADFDGDGKMDLAWQGGTGLVPRPTYFQAFGLGNGFFQLAPSVFPPLPANAGRSTDAQEIVTGDFNGDGHPDLAYRVTDATGAGDINGGFFTRVDVLLYNSASKSFALAPDLANILGPLNVIPAYYIDEVLGFADLDGDGKWELFAHAAAVKEYTDRPDTPERLYVWKPTLDPTATNASQLFTRTVFDNPHLNGGEKNTIIGFAVGDFNRDGKPDFAAAVSGATVISYGNGDFTFNNPTTYLTNNRGVQTGDVNGDGILDLITSWNAFGNFSSRPLLSALLGKPDGTFGDPQPLSTANGFDPAGLVVGDFNLDGKTDFATYSTRDYEEVFLAAPPSLAAVQSGDINGDGKLDIVGITTGFNRVKVLLGNGDNAFSRQSDLFVGASPVDLKLVDVDGDGKLDIVTANRIGQSVTVLHNNAGSYTRTDYALTARPNKVEVLDITGDSRPDIIAISQTGSQLNVLVNSATGLGAASALNLGFAPGGLTLADVTGDGKPDAIISDPNNKRIFILPGQGDGSFGSAKTVQLSASPVDVAIADMNFDGKPDIMVTLPESNRVGVLFNRGSGRFTNPQAIKVGDRPNSLVVKDVNGDNKPDLMVTNRDNTLSVILNRFDPTNLYRYTPTAIDPDGDPITFDFDSAPGGMLYDDATGQVLWAPMPDQIGNNEVVLRASDNRGGSATQGYTISVTAPTTTPPPVFTSQPVTAIPIDVPYSYQPSNTNPGDNPLRYSLVSGPEGMTVDPTTGAVTWDPRHNGLSLGIYRKDIQGPRFVNRGDIRSADSPSLHSPNVSAEGWFKFDSNEGESGLIRKAIFTAFDGARVSSWALDNAGGSLHLRIGNTDTFFEVYAPTALPTAQWLHLAFTFDGATKAYVLYVNGSPVLSGLSTLGISYDGNPLIVGQDLRGNVNDVRVWNKVRTAAEIREGMNTEVPSNSPGLVLDYDFTGGPAAASVLDRSPSQNHGSVNTTYDPYNYPTRELALSFTGTHAVTLKVEDGKGGVGIQSFNIDVVSQLRGLVTGTVTDSVTNSPLEGRNIFVDTNRNNYRDADEAFSTTNSQGQYTLNNLLATTSYVAIETMSGFASPAEHAVNVIAGQSITNDFELTSATPGLIRGQVSVDGVGTAIQGFEVYVDKNKNSVHDDGEASARTDRFGNYTLSEIGAGDYIVRIDTPAGWNVITPASGSNKVTLAANGIATGNDFKLKSTAEAASTPVFVSIPSDKARARTQFRYAAVAIDPLGRPLTYKLLAGPDSMAIDARTGVIVWTPTAEEIGPTRVLLKATNDRDGVAIQDFSLNVLTPNSAPIVTSDAAVSAVVSFPLRFDVLAQDAEQADLNYSLVSAPSGMSIDAATGRISWTPSAIQAGAQNVVIRIHDGVGGETRQTIAFKVSSANVNGKPSITSGPRSAGQVGRNFVGRVSASDIDNNPLTFSLVSGPVGMTITDDGRLNWQPNSAQSGTNTLRVRVDDGRGGSDEKDFNILIDSLLANRSPLLKPVDTALAVVDKIFAEDFSSSDADGDAVAYQLISGPSGLSLDSARGTLRWQPARDQLGVHSVTVRVVDPFGGFDEQTFNIVARSVGGPPAIFSVPPTMAAVGQTYIYSVQATDADSDPLTFSLSASPAGMTINPAIGLIAWTPSANQVGSQSAIVRVNDGAGGFTTQAFAVLVTPGVPNQPPVIHSQPSLDAVVGTPFSYAVQATDPEGSNITYALRSGPTSFNINATSGVVTWIPTATDIGTAVIVLTATDSGGAAGVQSFLVSVQATNNAPAIVSTAPTSVSQGGSFRYDVIATDLDHEPLTYELVNGPAGLTLDSLGRVRWQTALDTPLGSRTATFTVHDGRGGSATQTIHFDVVADTTPPRVSIIIQNGILFPWSTEPAIVKVTATDDVGVTNITLSLDGKMVALAPDGTTSVFFGGLGRLEAFAYDAAGNRGRGVGQVRMRSGTEDGSNNGATTPTVAITSLQDGDLVGGFVSIVGTASGVLPTDDINYVLSYHRGDEATFHEISRGNMPVNNGVLGKWDTTLLENDQYIFKLEATDDFGNFAAVEREVGVSGNFKLGNFRLSFADITIPVAGIPITLARTYDSLRADRDSELGFGWSLEFRNANLRTGLAKTGLEDLGIYAAFKPGTKVYLTLPGGSREGFTFTPDIRALGGFGNSLTIATPRFTADRGVKNTLSVRGGTYIVNPFGELIGGGGQPYNPAAEEFGGGYTLNTPEGIRYRIDGNTGLLAAATDRNNNTLSFTDSGISGSGVRLIFERDASGRITKAIDPVGNAMKYTYDSLGDLIKVTDRAGNATQFDYKTVPSHYLERIIDPLGRTGIRAEYGADGRLSATFDANGNAIRTAYVPDDQLVTIRDARGNPTILEYDSRGNLAATTDALGGISRFTYDTDGNVLSRSDALGRTSSNTYDSLGNLLSITDPIGVTSRFTYDAHGNIIADTDPLGRTTRYTLDQVGNVLATTGSDGLTTRFDIDQRGNPRSITDAAGNATTYEYDGAGRVVRQTDALGTVTQFVHDSNGNVTRTVVTSNTPSGPVNQETTTVYDALGRVTVTTDTLGNTTRSMYDADGRLSVSINASGEETDYRYDPAGRPVGFTYPGGTTGSVIYDATGHPTSSTDRNGRTQLFSYDAVGRQTEVVFPDATLNDPTDNPRENVEYDLAGQVVAKIDEFGGRTEYEYDADGRQTVIRGQNGAITRIAYDTVGRVTVGIDAIGRTTRYKYDDADRPIQTVLPDGAVIKKQYDSLGRLDTVTDPTGATTRFEYDTTGRLTTVVDVASGRTTYEYDDRGLLLAETDADGHTTHYVYDSIGQRTAVIRPLGERETTTYDSTGHVSAVTDADGRTIRYEYDAAERVAAERYDDGTAILYTYTSTGHLDTLTDPRGVTRYEYDSRDQLVRVTDPDGTLVAYEYDANGRTSRVSTVGGTTGYQYDANGRLGTATDSQAGITRYSYDAAGNLLSAKLPNGMTTAYQYDPNGAASDVIHSGSGGVAASYHYTFDSDGRRTGVVENTGRQVAYRYDLLGRLIEEVATGSSAGDRTTRYTYDAVGNRLTRDDSFEGTTTYTYDADDRLLTATTAGQSTTYTYDRTGDLIGETAPGSTTVYTWNSRRLLTGVSVATVSGTRTTTYEYDGAGRRVAQTVHGVTTRYTIDRSGANGRILEERNAAGDLKARLVEGLGTTARVEGGEVVYLLADAHSGTRALANATGQVVQTYTYDAFGQLTASTGADDNTLLYRAEQRDPLTGFDYLQARYYDPSIGRFISRDPSEGQVGLPTTRHGYMYAAADPVNKLDPSGTFTFAQTLVAINIIATVATIGLSVYHHANINAEYEAGLITLEEANNRIQSEWISLVVGYGLGWGAGKLIGTFTTSVAVSIARSSGAFAESVNAEFGGIFATSRHAILWKNAAAASAANPNLVRKLAEDLEIKFLTNPDFSKRFLTNYLFAKTTGRSLLGSINPGTWGSKLVFEGQQTITPEFVKYGANGLIQEAHLVRYSEGAINLGPDLTAYIQDYSSRIAQGSRFALTAERIFVHLTPTARLDGVSLALARVHPERIVIVRSLPLLKFTGFAGTAGAIAFTLIDSEQ